MIVNATTNSFESDVLKVSGLVIVDFWATWCAPCKMMNPVFEDLDKDYSDKVKIVKVDADQELHLVSKYQISSIPTMILFRDGQEVERIVGAKPKPYLIHTINTH
jgi:thioredoxin 1